MKLHLPRRTAASILAISIAGCTSTNSIRDIRSKADESLNKAGVGQSTFLGRLSERERIEQQEVARPFITGRSRPVGREVTLPAALRADVNTTMMFPTGRVDLLTLAERITLATGIQVTVRPDALLPIESFMPRLGGIAPTAGNTQAVSETISLPQGSQPLPTLLDTVANRLGIYWKYQDDVIELYRTETRAFNVRALINSTASAAGLGRTAAGSSAQSAGSFQSTSNTTITSAGGDPLAAVKAKIEPFLTRAGVVVGNADASNLVVVTDTKAALDRVDEYLRRENKALTRRVRLLFEEIEVADKNLSEQGLDWNLVYNAARGGLSDLSPTSLVGPTSGAIGASITQGPFAGSSLILKALSEQGTVVRHTTVPLQSLNRRPVTHAVRTTFTYIDQVQVTTVASSAGTSTAPSVTQKEETVGSFITLTPDAQDDGQILLSIAYDSTVALPLRTLTFGTTNNQVQLQQKTINGIGTVQQVELRPGQPVVISGFERSLDQYDRRRLDEGVPVLLGGSNKTSQERRTTIVVITAQVEEGL